jgi:transposase-like protein
MLKIYFSDISEDNQEPEEVKQCIICNSYNTIKLEQYETSAEYECKNCHSKFED